MLNLLTLCSKHNIYIDIMDIYFCYLHSTFTSRKVTGSKLNPVGTIFLNVCAHCHLVANHYIIITYPLSRDDSPTLLLLLLMREHYSHFRLIWFIWYLPHALCNIFSYANLILFIPAATGQRVSNLRSKALLKGTSWSLYSLLYLFSWRQLIIDLNLHLNLRLMLLKV